MKRRRIILICAAAFAGLLIALSYHALLVKPCIKIKLLDETVPYSSAQGEDIRLLCRPTQVTGAMFLATAIETAEGTFKPFDGYGLWLETGGEIPWDLLSEDITLYSTATWVLRGTVWDTGDTDGTHHMEVVDWEPVGPIRTIFRIWPFTRGIFKFDYKDLRS